jgi:hypothetical protein
MKEFKLLGNCQVCGRLQAVNSGMSQHGYTVKHGWFNGVCSGRGHKPMQQDGSVTKQVCQSILDEVADLTNKIELARQGKIKPSQAPVASHYKAELVPFDQAPDYMQKQTVKQMIFAFESRAKAGTQHVEMLTRLLNKVSGTDLIKEKIEKPPAQILIGEKRQGERHVMICKRVDGARIYWTTVSGLQSWTGVAAWRKLPLISNEGKV